MDIRKLVTKGIPGIGPVKLHAVVPRFLEAIARREKDGERMNSAPEATVPGLVSLVRFYLQK